MAHAAVCPSLPFAEWKETGATLHMWAQIIGKLRLSQCVPINHWWHVPLYSTARGLTTSPIPYGSRVFEVEFDFLRHELWIETSDGDRRSLPLVPRSVADFYNEVMVALRSLGIEIAIWTMPVEVPNPIPFEQDHVHATYDPEYARRFWHILLQSQRVFTQFRSRFLGKVSPVHFFWGSFDLALTRFSGRTAPEHPGAPYVADHVTREAYSHEVSSCGFWPGGAGIDMPLFYAYAYPEPEGFGAYPIEPKEAFYDSALREYVLPYEAMRSSSEPDKALMDFLESTYLAAAVTGQWDRESLERS